jgi:pyridoxine kinase
MKAKGPLVVVISSHVASGSVGNRAAVFALERLGFAVVAVPTVILPFHPGHGGATRIVPPADAFAALLADIGRRPWIGDVGAILSGYLGEAAQARPIAGLVAAVKKANPGAVYLCDPVAGDTGGPYVPAATIAAIAGDLMPAADMATPNLAELALFAPPVADRDGIVAAARRLGPAEVAVTSAAVTTVEVETLAVTADRVEQIRHRRLEKAPHGTGDLFAALYLGGRLKGRLPGEAAARAAFAVLRMAEAAGDADELPLAAAQKLLLEDVVRE